MWHLDPHQIKWTVFLKWQILFLSHCNSEVGRCSSAKINKLPPFTLKSKQFYLLLLAVGPFGKETFYCFYFLASWTKKRHALHGQIHCLVVGGFSFTWAEKKTWTQRFVAFIYILTGFKAQLCRCCYANQGTRQVSSVCFDLGKWLKK